MATMHFVDRRSRFWKFPRLVGLFATGSVSRESGSGVLEGIVPPRQAVTCSRVHFAPPPTYHLFSLYSVTPRVHILRCSVVVASLLKLGNPARWKGV